MNIQQIMDLFLKTGREYANKGLDIAEKKLDLPEDPVARDAMLSAAGKGALAAGAIAALLGTKTGRKLTGSALKLGSLAAIGGLAYQTYQEWQKQEPNQTQTQGEPVNELSGIKQEKRSMALLKAMIAAAQADGHIDNSERNKIFEQIQALGIQSETTQTIEQELTQSVTIKDLSKIADSPEAAAEMYLVSRIILDIVNPEEQVYLSELASALGLAPTLVAGLEEKLT